MPPRKRLLFAVLFTIVFLAASGTLDVCKAGVNALRPDTGLRALTPAAAASVRCGNHPQNSPSRPLALYRTDELLPASYTPIQYKNPRDLGVGKVLVASRGLGDPNFAATVILLVHYDEKGVLGLVLNRRTDVPISQVLDLKAAKGRSDPVYLGGPVEHSAVFALLQSSVKVKDAENIFGEVYLISEKDAFERTLSAQPDASAFHVYLGYAGWTQDQLRTEVQLGAWFIFPPDAGTIFNSDPSSLWLRMIHKTELHWAKAKPPQSCPPQPN